MKQNFDYVTMEDYSSDMAEVAQRSAHIIDAQRREIRELKTMFAAAVMAAGGKISIGNSYLIGFDRMELTAWIDEANDARVFTAKWKEAK